MTTREEEILEAIADIEIAELPDEDAAKMAPYFPGKRIITRDVRLNPEKLAIYLAELEEKVGPKKVLVKYPDGRVEEHDADTVIFT